MDFGLVGFDDLASRNPPQNNTQKWGGSALLKQEMAINEEEEEDDPFRGFKVAKTTSTYGSHWTGPESGSGSGSGSGRGAFSPSQWMELEHQALIYRYISSNVPIPCHLLNPIRKAFQSAACYTGLFPGGLRSNSLGWGGLHLGYTSGDPEPGRCRRTDGKKWRCSREAVAEGKYCERHMNRGRHRSRKPVEAQSGHSSTNTNTSKAIHAQFNATLQSNDGRHGRGQDSKSHNSLRQFADYWPDAALQPDTTTTQLSISIPTKGNVSSSEELEMGLGVGNVANEQRQVTNWVPISWESPIGGPLGEVLHSAGDCMTAEPLNLMDRWESSSAGASASVRVESGKKLDGGNRCNGFKGTGAVMNSSLPAL